MDFNLTEEHIMIRDAARIFAQTELLPGVIERDNKQEFPKEENRAVFPFSSILIEKLVPYLNIISINRSIKLGISSKSPT